MQPVCIFYTLLRMSHEIAFDSPEFREAFNLELQAERVRAACHAAEAARSRGVAWSGFAPDPRPTRPIQAIADAALARVTAGKAWLASPQGAFISALAEGQRAAAEAHNAAEAARAAASRNFLLEASHCRRAVTAMEAHGRRLVAAARRARRAIRPESHPCA